MSWLVSPQEEGLTAGESHSELWSVSKISDKFNIIHPNSPNTELFLRLFKRLVKDLLGSRMEFIRMDETHAKT